MGLFRKHHTALNQQSYLARKAVAELANNQVSGKKIVGRIQQTRVVRSGEEAKAKAKTMPWWPQVGYGPILSSGWWVFYNTWQ